MALFLIITTVTGLVLGLRFKMFVLGPAMFVAAAATIAHGIAGGHSYTVIALALFEAMASLQIGYIIGCLLQANVSIRTAGRYRRPRWEPTQY
jgi:hypothetical protein